MNWILRAAITVAIVAVAVLAASKIFADVRMRRPMTAVTVGVVFGVLNVLLGWLVRALVGLALLPAALVTFGLAFLLFGFLVNSILLWLTDKLVEDFEIDSLRGLFGTAAMIGLATWAFGLFVR